MTETKTYADGSQRVGEPPFPKLSPLEQAAGAVEPETNAAVDGADAEPAKRGRKAKAQ